MYHKFMKLEASDAKFGLIIKICWHKTSIHIDALPITVALYKTRTGNCTNS